MASKEELTEQLAVTQKLAAAVDAMARSMSRVESSYATQINAVEKLTKAIESLKSQDLSSLNSTKLSGFQKEMGESERAVTGLSGRMKDLGTGMRKNFPVAAASAAAALTGFWQGLKNVAALGKATVGVVTSLVDGMFNIAAAIIAIPFKMFEGLVGMATKSAGGMNELAVAIEKVRKQFGDLKGPGAGAVIATGMSLKGFSDTGLSAFRVFGTLAERLEAVLEVATAMDATFGKLQQEFRDNGGALLAFQKGLGASAEQMKAIGDRAITMGKPMTKVFIDMTKQTLALGKAFDLDQKVIGRDMAKALQDVKHFGQLTVKEIGQASVYARKLGLELDKIVGTLDAFETFDQAAESAAKLSQTFGVQVDAFKLMESQDPAEQIDMLRKSFKAAGVDASNFTRQQLKLLSTTTGLDEATAKQAFSLNNQGVSLDSIRKKSDAAEKKTMTQAEALSKLADSIERLIKSGGELPGGFFDAFIKGITMGISSSKEFREIMINIRQAVIAAMQAGFKLGRALAEMKGPIKDVFQALSSLFDPKKFGKLFSGISATIEEFTKNPKMTFEELMEKFRKQFFDFFDSEKPAARKLINAFKTIFKKVSQVFAEGIRWVSKQIAEGLKSIAEFLKNPTAFFEKAKQGGGGAVGFFAEVFEPLFYALKDGARLIWPHFQKVLEVLWDKLVTWFKTDGIKLIKPALPYIAGAIFGPALTRALLGAATASLGKAVFGMIAEAFAGPAAAAGAQTAAKAAGGLLSRSFAGLGRFLGPIGIAVAVGTAAVNVKDALDKFEKDLAPKFGEAEAKMGAASAGIIHALTFGLLPEGIERTIAEKVAGLSKAMFGAIEKFLGPNFSKRLKEYISADIDLFGSLGSLIKSLFTGDEDKIADAFVDLGKKLLTLMKKSFLFLIDSLPTLGAIITKFAFKLLATIARTVGKVIEKGENIPIFGGVLKGLSAILNFAGTVFDKVGDMFGRIANFFKKDGVLGGIANLIDENVLQPVVNIFTKVWTTIKRGFEATWNAVKGVWSAVGTFFNDNVWQPLKTLFDTVVDIIKKPFQAAYDAVGDIFSIKHVKEIFMKVVDAIAETLDKLLKLPVFADMIKIAKKVFKIASPSQVFVEMGDAMVEGMDKGLKDMPAVMKKNMAATSAAAASQSPNHAATAVGPALGAVAEMVKQTQALDDQLSRLPKLGPITAKLGAVAKAAGLGGKAVYTVQSKDVKIDVTVNVVMNVDEVERVMIMRAKSTLRDAINFTLTNPSDKSTTVIPDTYSKAPLNFGTKSE